MHVLALAGPARAASHREAPLIALEPAADTAGMLLLSGLVALPFALAAPHAEGLRTVLQVGAGVASATLGAGMLAGPAGS